MAQEKRGLGRGIASLVRTPPSVTPSEPLGSVAPAAPAAALAVDPVRAGVAEVSGGMLQVPVASIALNPFQPRKFFDGIKIEELAQSIREHGVLCPLIVARRDSGYELISGERRLRAATLAGLEKVPAVLREGSGSESLEIALIENIQREDLNPMEEAGAYQELCDRFGYTQDQVADRVGKDRSTVSNLIRLMKLPTKVKQALQAGQITVGHARALIGVPEIERQIYFVDQIVAHGWSVRELELRISSRRAIGPKQKVRDLKPLPLHLVQILDELRRRLGTQVRLVPSGKKGKIIIDYYSDEDLDRIYSVLVKS